MQARNQSAANPADGMSEATLSEWLERAQAGDHEAFERIYRQHVGTVYGICVRMVHDRLEAERLTQDVFVRVWEKLDRFRREGPFGAWLRRVAVNVVVEDRRSRARDKRWIDLEEDPAPEHRPSVGTGSGMRSTEISLDLETAIRLLPEGARTAFVLHDVYGYRHREIAKMTSVATATVRVQLHRARTLMRSILDGSREVSGS